jgi:hypothetical protein
MTDITRRYWASAATCWASLEDGEDALQQTFLPAHRALSRPPGSADRTTTPRIHRAIRRGRRSPRGG